MGRYIFKRLLMTLVVIVLAAVVIFTLVYFVKGDPASVLLGAGVDEAELLQKRIQLGLEDPFFVQMGKFLYNVFFKFDFGTSWLRGSDVLDGMLSRLPYTIILGLIMVTASALVGIPLGVISAIYQDKWQDKVTRLLSMFFISVPDFWFALMLVQVFSLELGWLPAFGAKSLSSFILPIIAGSINGIGALARTTRSSMLEVIRSDFVTTARSKGLKESVVICRHMLKNALIPVITTLGAQIGKYVAGVVIIEQIFSLPGVGVYMTTGISSRDYPIVRGCVIVLAAFTSLIVLLVDIAYAYVDPRIKAQYMNQKKKRVKKVKEEK